MMKLHITPRFRGTDRGDGGIRRVVEAQRKYLPPLGWELVDTVAEADLVASHAGNNPEVPVAKPWVAHCHGVYWSELEWHRWHYALNNEVVQAMRRADQVTAPSEWVAQALRRGMWLRPQVIGHGVDLEDWPGVDHPTEGYVLWNKGRPDAVCDPQPVAELAGLMPDQEFVTTFYPDGVARPGNVQVTGKLPYQQARELLTDAGVYLCTTRETFGIGTLEAMASGVPVVGWNWGGQREIISHQVTGWLATPGDFQGLAQGIQWALDNRPQVAQAAYELVDRRYRWDQVIPQYDALYRWLLESFTARAEAPRVSVVVPCYNLARYLPEAVESVKEQTLEDWEVIIVDDASTDDTPQVMERLCREDHRIRGVSHERNRYLSTTLNSGIAAARGQYIMALDADNRIAPRTLALLVEALDQDRGTAIAYGACQFIQEDGTPAQHIGRDGVSSWPQEFEFGQQMLQRNQVPSTCLYRREVWEQTGGYRARWRTAEDADFWTRAASYGFTPRKVTNEVTLVYRNRQGQMSQVNPLPNYAGWYPWSRKKALVPPAAAGQPPRNINDGLCWHFPSYEPVTVSVIIPVGPGHQGYLVDALDSLEAQTFRQWEAIVVNDTGEPLAVPHPWARVFEHGGLPQQGPATSRNRGLSVSRGKLVLFLDADDYLQPHALEAMVQTWHATGGVIYGQWWDDLGDSIKLYDPPEWDARLLIAQGCIHCVTALYPRADLLRLGGFDQGLSHWEDWDLQIRLAATGVCGVKITTPVFTYRKATGTRREQNLAAFDVGRDAILAKWHKFWDGSEDIMAGCGGCPGGGGVRLTAPRTGGLMATQDTSGLVLLEYTGTSQGTVTFRPPNAGGVSYRFNAGESRFQYVYPEHATWLMGRGAFRKAEAPATAGAPERIEAHQPRDIETPIDSGVSNDPAIDTAGAKSSNSTPGDQYPPEIIAGPVEDSPPFDPQGIDTWTPAPLREIVGSLPEDQVGEALVVERQGRNRRDVLQILQERLAA